MNEETKVKVVDRVNEIYDGKIILPSFGNETKAPQLEQVHLVGFFTLLIRKFILLLIKLFGLTESYVLDTTANVYYGLKLKNGKYVNICFTNNETGNNTVSVDISAVLKEHYYIFHQTDGNEPFKRLTEAEFNNALSKTLSYL